MRLAESVGRAMKRFLIFLLLGPLLGLLVFMLRNAFAGKIVGGFMGFVFGLPFGYLFGLPIVLVMWVEDWFLSDKNGAKNESRHICVRGIRGLHRNAAATSALHLQLPQILSFGIVGAIPAAVCSWLAGTTENRGTSRQ
jgi:hypothetical protein